MFCGKCGQALLVGQEICPRCGTVNVIGVRPRVGYVQGPPSLSYLERRVNSLAVAWYVYAGIVAVTGVFGLAFAQSILSGHMGPWMNGQNGHSHWHGFGGPFSGPFSGNWLPLFFVKLGWVWLALRAGLAFAAGYGLMHKTSWGRWVAIVAGVLALLHFPFGTAMGIWTLMVLANASNAAGYEVLVRE
jgi:hypothetical protein